MHSNPSSSCEVCAEKLKKCHHSLNLWAEIIQDNFKDCHIAVGFRNEVEQQKALEDKLTNAPWPKSKHNRMENGQPKSWAIDIFRLGDDGKGYWEEVYFEKIWEFINKLQIDAGDSEMFWGGLFQHLADKDHLELLKVEIVQRIEVLSQDTC